MLNSSSEMGITSVNELNCYLPNSILRDFSRSICFKSNRLIQAMPNMDSLNPAVLNSKIVFICQSDGDLYQPHFQPTHC